MTLLFEEEVDVLFPFNYKEVAQKVIEQTLEEEAFPFDVEVGITLTDDENIHQMNREFRQIDRSTDVLSFPLIEAQQPYDYDSLEEMDDVFHPESGEAMLGDIVISVEHVFRQAEEFGHSVLREYGFLIAHSMLHLLGYDHIAPEEAAIMENKQTKILDLLNITREE